MTEDVKYWFERLGYKVTGMEMRGEFLRIRFADHLRVSFNLGKVSHGYPTLYAKELLPRPIYEDYHRISRRIARHKKALKAELGAHGTEETHG